MIKLFILASAVIFTICLPITAPAQQETTHAEEMIVSAQKRTENVQDVPISIDLFSDQKLDDLGIENIHELIMYSPNVTMKSNTAETAIVIRGVSSFGSAIYSPAGFYVDDVCYPLSYMSNIDIFDVQRIEVLKGPQGTLYGRNTESGLINVVTRQPDNQFRGKVDLSLGAYDSEYAGIKYRAGASVSGPIQEDHLFLSMAVHGLHSDGFRRDLVSGEDGPDKESHLIGQGVLRYTPNSDVDISFSAGFMNNNDGFGVYRLVDGPTSSRKHTIRSGDPDLEKNEKRNNQNLKVKYHGSGWDLVSISSRQVYSNDFTSDMDFSGGASYSLFGYDDTLWSQEVRVTSQEEGLITWLAGLYLFHEETNTMMDIRNRLASGSFWNPVGEIDTAGYAAFSQVTLHPIQKFHISAGLRYDHQELEGKVINHSTAMMPSLPSNPSYSDDLSYDEILPKFSITYNLTPTNTLYVSAAKGYMTGGYNYSMVTSQDVFTYDSEYSWSYELGSKNSFLNNRLIINAAVFYTDIKDKQIDVNNPSIAGVPAWLDIRNAGKAHTYGAEISVISEIAQGLKLFGNLGLLQTEIDQWSYESTTGPVNYEGNQLAYAPDYSFDIGAIYHHNSGLFMSGAITGKGEQYGDAANTVKQDPFELVNLNVGYETESYDIVLWCKNIFDKEYYTLMDAMSSTGALKVVEGDPRIIGLTLRYRF